MHFTVEAHRIASQYIGSGDIVVDATAGNGFDTLFLANTVGESGLVYAIDIQACAIEIVEQKATANGLIPRIRLFQRSHSELANIIEPNHAGNVSAVLFNLGYLPFGDKSLVTTPATTIPALETALNVLKPGGLLSVLVYSGHDGGKTESDSVTQWIEGHAVNADSQFLRDESNPRSPTLWTIIKKSPNT